MNYIDIRIYPNIRPCLHIHAYSSKCSGTTLLIITCQQSIYLFGHYILLQYICLVPYTGYSAPGSTV